MIYLSVFAMNYIKRLQADKAETLDSARSIEAAINHLISYLSCPKSHLDTRVQVGDVLRDLLPIEPGANQFAGQSTSSKKPAKTVLNPEQRISEPGKLESCESKVYLIGCPTNISQ